MTFVDKAKDWQQQLRRDGFAVVPEVIPAREVERLRHAIDVARRTDSSSAVSNSSGTYGLRNLTDAVPETAELVRSPKVAAVVRSTVGSKACMVRATLFDKTEGANWGVFWHQDLSIAVKERVELAGFHSWTRKAGVPCVQPPVGLMQRMLAVRIHLDDCSAENGALKVLPGTHRLDTLSTADVESQQQTVAEVVCNANAGDALLMRPLLLHASSPMDTPTSRRVIHLEFADFDLPSPLEWRFRLPVQTSDADHSNG